MGRSERVPVHGLPDTVCFRSRPCSQVQGVRAHIPSCPVSGNLCGPKVTSPLTTESPYRFSTDGPCLGRRDLSGEGEFRPRVPLGVSRSCPNGTNETYLEVKLLSTLKPVTVGPGKNLVDVGRESYRKEQNQNVFIELPSLTQNVTKHRVVVVRVREPVRSTSNPWKEVP